MPSNGWADPPEGRYPPRDRWSDPIPLRSKNAVRRALAYFVQHHSPFGVHFGAVEVAASVDWPWFRTEFREDLSPCNGVGNWKLRHPEMAELLFTEGSTKLVHGNARADAKKQLWQLASMHPKRWVPTGDDESYLEAFLSANAVFRRLSYMRSAKYAAWRAEQFLLERRDAS